LRRKSASSCIVVIQIQIQSSTQNSLYLCVPVEEIDNVVDACLAFYNESPGPLGHLLVVVDNLHQAQLLHLPPEASLLVVNKASLYYSLVAKDLLQGVLRVDFHGGLVESLKQHGSRFAHYLGEERRQLEWHSSPPCS
jgi:hypothetical protein